MPARPLRTGLLAALAVVAFAANSLLCRAALREGAIDPATFSTIRFASGAVTLSLLTARRGRAGRERSWVSALVLVAYALPFSLAYTRLTAGTGALMLFGAVQVTMIAWAIRAGERPGALQWAGITMAVAGLIYLVSPGVAAPPITAAVLMVVAGVGWGLYSLRGRTAANPLRQTADNFLRSVPVIIAANIALAGQVHVTRPGLWLACASGVLASGLGYVIWYSALPGLTATRAAVVQLAVPVVAAAGGIAFLDESLTTRLAIGTGAVLGGIGLAIAGRERRRRVARNA